MFRTVQLRSTVRINRGGSFRVGATLPFAITVLPFTAAGTGDGAGAMPLVIAAMVCFMIRGTRLPEFCRLGFVHPVLYPVAP
ncbi:hypothetical protein [Ostreiculturibacter nitratireducens]|uniref:hypothetical protein n=1 Tax=Ostreiculturibacter nitratireducens TaxID=3075226 RepID=UPI0031B5DD93